MPRIAPPHLDPVLTIVLLSNGWYKIYIYRNRGGIGFGISQIEFLNEIFWYRDIE